MQERKNTIIQQIDAALARHDELVGKERKPGDYAHLSRSEVAELIARLSSTIDSLTPDGHRYRKLTAVTLKQHGTESPDNLEVLVGYLRALREDIEQGYLRRWEELVRADLFSNLLDIASHFLGEGFLDAAAVMAGGALEQHLRNLCIKKGILSATDPDPHRYTLWELREKLIADRYIDASENRSIKNWAKIRNRAAHRGDPEIKPDEIRLMIEGIALFIRKHSA